MAAKQCRRCNIHIVLSSRPTFRRKQLRGCGITGLTGRLPRMQRMHKVKTAETDLAPLQHELKQHGIANLALPWPQKLAQLQFLIKYEAQGPASVLANQTSSSFERYMGNVTAIALCVGPSLTTRIALAYSMFCAFISST